MYAIGNEELEHLPPLGETVECPHCGGTHKVEYGVNKDTGETTTTIAFYTCGDDVYLCGISGKYISFTVVV